MKTIQDITDKIRTEVPTRLLRKIQAPVGSDLNKAMIDFMSIKKILYDCLVEIETKEVLERYHGRQ